MEGSSYKNNFGQGGRGEKNKRKTDRECVGKADNLSESGQSTRCRSASHE